MMLIFPTSRPESGAKKTESWPQVNPAVDIHHLILFRVLHQQAGPGVFRHLPEAVEHGGKIEPPDILGEGPQQAGEGPAEQVEDQRRPLASQLVGDRPAEGGRAGAEQQRQGRHQAHLNIVGAQSQHIYGDKRHIQAVGNAPQRLGQHTGLGVPPELQQCAHHGLLLHIVSSYVKLP